MKTVRAVDRVWADETLSDFWRNGKLVANRLQQHPYRTDIPAKYRDIPRWYLLDTNLDPPRPWGETTDLPVFSLAMVRGEQDQRQWLLYAHSPLADREDVEITIPGYEKVTVDIPRAGAFYLINRSRGSARRLNALP